MDRTARQILLLGLLLLPSRAMAAGVEWRADFDGALAAALEQGRPVLIDFWASWCEPCHAMDAELWSRPDVAGRVARLVALRLDVDVNPRLVRRFDVRGIPAVVVVDGWGEVIGAIAGYTSPQPYLAMLEAVPTDLSPIADWCARFDDQPGDLEAALEIGRFYQQQGLYQTSDRFFEKGLRRAGRKADVSLRGELLLGRGVDHLELGEPREALESFERAARLTGFERGDLALFGGLIAEVRLGRLDEARESLAELIERFPESPLSLHARRIVDSTAASESLDLPAIFAAER